MKKNESYEEFVKGIWRDNPVFVQVLGMCPVLAVTSNPAAGITLGGTDARGEDASNELTYLILDVIEEMRLLQPSSSIQVSKKNPDRFVKRAAKIIRTGFGQPSVFNADTVIAQQLRQGKSLADARHYPAIDWVGSFSDHVHASAGWWAENVSPAWEKRRAQALGLLARFFGPDGETSKETLVLCVGSRLAVNGRTMEEEEKERGEP